MPENDQTRSPVETQKVVRLISFLLEVARLRTRLIRDIGDYETILWLSDIPNQSGCFTQAWGRADNEREQDEWLEVQNRREPKRPPIPTQCKGWADETTLSKKHDLPELLSEVIFEIPNPDHHQESDEPGAIADKKYLIDHPETQKAWDQYIEQKWLPWAEEHNAWEKAHKVYSALFSIHQSQLRLGEEYELVLGLGLLTWQTPTGQRVRRHLIVSNAVLVFEAHKGKFTVHSHPQGAELRPELDMLDITDQPAGAEQSAKNALISAEDNPWDEDCLERTLQELAHSISPHGVYEKSLEAKARTASAKPVVEYAPALILRKRSSKGLTESLKRIRGQIENSQIIPDEFADLAEIRPFTDRDPCDEPGELGNANTVFDGKPYFPKPSNKEQQCIVEKMRSSSGVLVQGPPGTGKSHTIANLICHLLATGQRILITAKTPRALQVLQGHLPEELRPLCINLLGTGIDERQSLELSVDGILRKEQSWNETQAKRDQEQLEKRLQDLRQELIRISHQLYHIREAETHKQTVAEGAYQGTAARIAEQVNRNRPDFEWFTDSVPLNKACPIAPHDLLKTLESLRQFTPEMRRELALEWPETLPTSVQFSNLVREEANAKEEEHKLIAAADERLVDLLEKINPDAVETIHSTFTAFDNTCRRLRAASHPWITDALRDTLGGNSALWHKRLSVTLEIIATINHLVATADNLRVDLPENRDIRLLYEDARVLQQYMENGGTLGWGLFRSKPVKERSYVIKDVKIDGRLCTTAEQFSLLANVLHVRIQCEKAWDYWKDRATKIEGPYSLQLTALNALCDALEMALSLETHMANCRGVINQFPGINEPVWADESQVEKIVSSCQLALARQRRRHSSEEILHMEMALSRIDGRANTHPLTNNVLTAIRNRDVITFSQCASNIEGLKQQRQQLLAMDELLSQLRHLLPQLTDTLEKSCNESCWEERAQRIADAWHWAQARHWIDNHIRQEDAPALSKRAKQIEGEINATVAKLASLHAWSFCFSSASKRKITAHHRRNMQAWKQAIQRLGRGTGIHAPLHRRAAQKHLNACREAVPAWVMPLHRIWDTVDPAPGIFDVIIVDEASQCGLEALPLFYLGKKILIVGDDKQISPDAVGLPRNKVQQLMQQHLHDFQFKTSFDVESSLFDHGKLRYGTRQITLREHFRCMPEIIRFSNDLCYSGTPLIPLRQYGPDRLPPLDHVFVSGGYREGTGNRVVNRPEAEAVVEKIAALCGDRRYNGKTMGVVVLQGEAQAAMIENLLLERIGSEEIEKRRLICGNPYSFQGDERDIMFLSLVAAINERIGPLTKEADKRRFNVAASRAKDQMILFHSVTRNDLSVHDLRRRFLEFFETSGTPEATANGQFDQDELERRAVQDNRHVVKPPPEFDSWFEVDVALELLRRGFHIRTQHEVAGKRIDLVVEGGNARLAVECDGDHWHGADRYEDDMQRQRQLERCGWEFFRVRESAFYSNRDFALAGLWQALKDRDIFPVFLGGNPSPTDDLERDRIDAPTNDADDNDAEVYIEEEPASADLDNHRKRRVDEITTKEIKDAIVSAIASCPQRTCTLKSLTSRVLKELGILTHGNPRAVFERKVMKAVRSLERSRYVEKYRTATNDRIRLLIEPPKNHQEQLSFD